MISLYLKYRPLTFDDIVDQEVPRRTLQNAVALGKVSHAYLFCGPRGTGKTSMARILAKALVCASPTPEGNPCAACELCEAAANGSLVDIIEIDAASNRGIDEIRALKERINFAPTQAAKKVYIIDEVHMLTKDAFNALLKTLEEPPSHAHFILATTEIHKVLDTIISRCQRYDFRRISQVGTTDRLAYIASQEGFGISRDALELIATSAQGGLRDAIRTLEQLAHTGMTELADVQRFLGYAGLSRIQELVQILMDGNTSAALDLVEELYQTGVQMRELCKELIFALRDLMIRDIEAGKKDQLGMYVRLIEIFDTAKNQLKHTVIEQLPLELACVRACEDLTISTPSAPPKKTVKVTPPPAPVSPAPEPAPAPVSTLLDDLFSAPSVPVAAMEEAPIELPSAVEPVAHAAVDLSTLQKEWKKFSDTVDKSSVKFCLKEGRPERLEGERLIVAFPNYFSMEKVLEPVNRDLVHTSLRAYFHTSLELVGEVRDMEIPTAPAPASHTPSPSSPASDVLSVFGGSELL